MMPSSLLRWCVVGLLAASSGLGCDPLFEAQVDPLIDGREAALCTTRGYDGEDLDALSGIGLRLSRGGRAQLAALPGARLQISGQGQLTVDFEASERLGLFAEARFEGDEGPCPARLALRLGDGHELALCVGRSAIRGVDGAVIVALSNPKPVVRVEFERSTGRVWLSVDGARERELSGLVQTGARPVPGFDLAAQGAPVVLSSFRWGCPQPRPVDCLDGRPSVELCNTLDDDCDGRIDEDFVQGATGTEPALGEVCTPDQCRQQTGLVVCSAVGGLICQPNAAVLRERCGDGEDNDCDGRIDETVGPNDADGDGAQACRRCDPSAGPVPEDCSVPFDCDDEDPQRREGLAEICDALDTDCDGRIDEDFDQDRDGHSTCLAGCGPGIERRVVDPNGSWSVSCNRDCDDTNAQVHPTATELCDDLDNNCDGEADEPWISTDAVGVRRYSAPSHCGDCQTDCTVAASEKNYAPACLATDRGYACSRACADGFRDLDRQTLNGCECRMQGHAVCDDTLPRRDQSECAERCDGDDDDCDGVADEAADLRLPPCYDGQVMSDPPVLLGACRLGRSECQEGRIKPGACVGQRLPNPEICDGIDNDCDGSTDEGLIGAPCQTGRPGVCGAGRRSCDAGLSLCVPETPMADELCNLLDDDCDGIIDEDTDRDRDGSRPCRACGPGEVPRADGTCELDCNDANRLIHPDAQEHCNGIDDNCAFGIDEPFVLRDLSTGWPTTLEGGPASSAEALVYTGTRVAQGWIRDCGGCGVNCVTPGAVPSCDTGVCQIAACLPGWTDRDGRADTGCEAITCGPRLALFDSLGQGCQRPIRSASTGAGCACRGVWRCIDTEDTNGDGRVDPRIECAVLSAEQRIEAGLEDDPEVFPPGLCPAPKIVGAQRELCDQIDNDCDGTVDEGPFCGG